MSRSYRKNLIVTDGQRRSNGITNARKLRKRQASKAVRREEDVADGGYYTKVYDSWNICDYRFRLDKHGNVKETRIWKWRSK